MSLPASGAPSKTTTRERGIFRGGKTDIYLMLLGVDRRADGGDQNADVILVAHVDLINEGRRDQHSP